MGQIIKAVDRRQDKSLTVYWYGSRFLE